mgnify:FL=1
MTNQTQEIKIPGPGRVTVESTDGEKWTGCFNGKNYNGSIYVRGLKIYLSNVKSVTPVSGSSDWGGAGIRYDEGCDNCGNCGEVDNNSGCCRRCHGSTPKISQACAAPYQRGIGQGFGATEDGDI